MIWVLAGLIWTGAGAVAASLGWGVRRALAARDRRIEELTAAVAAQAVRADHWRAVARSVLPGSAWRSMVECVDGRGPRGPVSQGNAR